MNKINQESRMKEALDLLLEGDIDISSALSEGGNQGRVRKVIRACQITFLIPAVYLLKERIEHRTSTRSSSFSFSKNS